MSRLADSLRPVLMDEMKIRPQRLRHLDAVTKSDFLDRTIYSPTRKHRLQATFFAEAFIDDEVNKRAIQPHDVYRDLRASIVNEVFGEFRPIIMEMYSAIHDIDTVRVRTLVSELEKKMFQDI